MAKRTKKAKANRERVTVRFLDGSIQDFVGDVVAVDGGSIFIHIVRAATVIPLRNVRYYSIQ